MNQTLPLPQMRLQRATGEVRASWHLVNGQVRLDRLRQQGSAKAIPLPGPEVVILNTSGGITGGDHLSINLDVGAGCRLTATTQTAERLYRASEGIGRMEVNLTVGQGGHLDWLPQETIAFQGSNTHRTTRITLAENATCLACETLVLGRTAMGETVIQAQLRDWREVTRGTTPLYIDPLVLDAKRLEDSAAGLAGAKVVASVIMIAPNVQDALGPLRATFTDDAVTAGASAFEGKLTLRLLGPDAWPVRKQMIRILNVLRKGALPRVWQT